MVLKSWAVALAAPTAAVCAVFTTKLQSHTIAAWDRYVETAERQNANGRPPLNPIGDKPVLVDLNPNGDLAGRDVPDGYIHHWVGAIRIPGIPVASVRAVLEDYTDYPRIYAPDVKQASAVKVAGGAYDVRMVMERIEGLLHFAFDVSSHVTFSESGGAVLVDSRSYRIRESDSGHAPYTDLLPEGQDHGILWRLNSYWRLRQMGPDVYAECQVISLSRKPLFGMRDQIKSRARDSLAATLRGTRARAMR